MNTPTKKNLFFKNYDLYSDANPTDTIRIKYTTINDVKNTIKKLEKLYKTNKYPHVRIVQVANVMTQRLRVINERIRSKKGKDRYNLSERYFNFLKERTKSKDRKKMVFKLQLFQEIQYYLLLNYLQLFRQVLRFVYQNH